MEFLQLKYFQHAAKCENFSHTAAFFITPPSAVSSSIKKLEQELGVSLFDRTSNKIRLNENGRLFLSCVDDIFQSLETTKRMLSERSNVPGGKIKILVITNRRILTQMISDFHTLYPNVSFTLDFDEGKNHREYDIIITDTPINCSEFKAYDFLCEEICLAVSSKHPLASRRQVSMEELAHEKFICLHTKHSLRTITDRLCKEALFVPEIAVECNDIFYVREYLKMGMGISIVPLVSWGKQLDPTLSLLRINRGVWRESKLYVKQNTSTATQTFFDYVVQQKHSYLDVK